MRRKQRPKEREEWRMSTSIPRDLFTEKDAQEIADELKIKFSPQLCRKYADAVHYYLVTQRLIDNRPLHSEKRVKLANLARCAEEFSQALNDLDDLSRIELYPLEWDWLDNIAAQTTVISGKAKRAVEKLKKSSAGKRHRPPRIALISLASVLLGIYTEATGKKPTLSRDSSAFAEYDPMKDAPMGKAKYFKSRFYSFMEKGLMKIPGHPKISNIAIGKAIESARKNPIISISAS